MFKFLISFLLVALFLQFINSLDFSHKNDEITELEKRVELLRKNMLDIK
jgi:hypothetical protein